MKFENICQTIFISLIIIFLFHYLFYYLQATFTQPKVKDMINRPNEKYNSIMKVVNSEIQDSNNTVNVKDSDSDNMKNELDNYINQISGNQITNNVTEITNLNQNFNNTKIANNGISNNDNENDSTPITQLAMS